MVVQGAPSVGASVMVQLHRGGDSRRRVRFYPARVHTVLEHSRVGHAAVTAGATAATSVRVVFAERHHTGTCKWCAPVAVAA